MPTPWQPRGTGVCRPLFEEYVGLDYNLSDYTFWAYYPEPYRWPDDRTIHCALGTPRGRLTKAA